jgi:hypothetical protein
VDAMDKGSIFGAPSVIAATPDSTSGREGFPIRLASLKRRPPHTETR